MNQQPMTIAQDALVVRGWVKQGREWTHAAHPSHVVTVNRAGAWVHYSPYSTGYKIHARSTDAARLAAHLDASRALAA